MGWMWNDEIDLFYFTEEGVNGEVKKVDVKEENFEELAKELQNASPLEIMDKALEKFGNDIAIAFR